MSLTETTTSRRRSTRRRFRFDRRASGLLLHPTSLPGPHGSGDLGPQAYRFADFLESAAQHWWQMLPINPPGAPPGNSPYSSTSAFAGSPWLISLERLAEDGLLDRSDVQPAASFNGAVSVNFGAMQRFRMQRLRKAFAKFESQGGLERDDFVAFCESSREWLDDAVLYYALKDAHRNAPWSTWSVDLRLRKPAALHEARKSLAGGVRFHQFVQFIFDRHWMDLKRYCNQRDIGLIGDIPIFVAHDSADVWANRELFLLDPLGRPITISGYPPDAFNRLGQRWGHPQYDWKVHLRQGFAWWISRFRHALRQFDAARIDHFLGFHRTWHVPAGARNARKGKWVDTPGDELFTALRRAMGRPLIIAEDLGRVTDEAQALRDKFKFPGMRILQFGFGDDPYHLPHNYVRRCVAYPGTHDNNTIVGWLHAQQAAAKRGGRDSIQRQELDRARLYVGEAREGFHMAVMRALLASVADMVIFPMQDILGLDEDFRMNIPGKPEGNWGWRLRTGQLGAALAAKLRQLNDVYGRT